jgi:hypothetical protein
MYAQFMYHKYAPLLYSVIGSRNFALFILTCYVFRIISSLIGRSLALSLTSSSLSLVNLTSIMLLNHLKNYHVPTISTEIMSEYIRYISVDILLSFNLNSFWIGIQSIICASILLKFVL